MCLRPLPIPAVPEQTARVARAAFPKGNPYLTMRDEFGAFFEDPQFAALFPHCVQPEAALVPSPLRVFWSTTSRSPSTRPHGSLSGFSWLQGSMYWMARFSVGVLTPDTIALSGSYVCVTEERPARVRPLAVYWYVSSRPDCGKVAFATSPGISWLLVSRVYSYETTVCSVADGVELAIGDVVLVEPAHLDPTVNLHDVLFVWDPSRSEVERWPVDARRILAV